MTQSYGPIFTIKLRPLRRGSKGIHELRALLKRLLRGYDMRCIEAREDQSHEPDDDTRLT